MCGIVGLFLKDQRLEPELGVLEQVGQAPGQLGRRPGQGGPVALVRSRGGHARILALG